jgi:transcriptional regulator with XRE-family HTH domain
MDISQDTYPNVSPRAYFAAEIRKRREAAGVSQKELARRVPCSTSQVGMIENGYRKASRQHVERVDAILRLGGDLVKLWTRTELAATQLPAWFRPWLEVERDAQAFRTWEPLVVPGLLQTRDYAEAMLRGEPGMTPEELDQKIALRMERQEILSRPKPPVLWVVLDEGVLHRPIGADGVMTGQLKHLVEAARQPHITIQVLPFSSRATAGLGGAFVIAEMPGENSVLYIDSIGHGQVSEQPKDVAALNYRYEVIRAESLSHRESLKLIEEAAQKWI